ncbi:glycosyltransferase family 2 protein [Photobacterium leiognathi]|uniref:glycosyltransferase family 2 protein n=1 Tax=Photobacterium leiognathi TaxID=553611 RepID=UPI0029818079|nr:glycosyltransferase family 2 protein [Photobacterium leiognathi]
MSSKVCAIIVTYNSDIDAIDNIRNVSGSVSKVIVVDNNSNDELKESLLSLDKLNNNISVHFLNENIGLSKAQNFAIKYALKEGFNWFLMLDDDSKLSNEFVSKMLAFYEQEKKTEIGVIVPAIKDLNSGDYSKFIINSFPIQRKFPDEKVIYPLVAISSGMLINRDVFVNVGIMNEDFFIDYIDIDFSLRVSSQYKIAYCPNVVLYHKLGVKRKVKFLFFNITVSNHSSFRRFYIYRNRIKVWLRYFRKYPSYIVYEILVSVLEFFKILFFEKNKLKNLISIVKGIVSGFKG